MTYTLFEYCRDSVDSLIPENEESITEEVKEIEDKINSMEVWFLFVSARSSVAASHYFILFRLVVRRRKKF